MSIGKLGASGAQLDYYERQVADGLEDYYSGRGEAAGSDAIPPPAGRPIVGDARALAAWRALPCRRSAPSIPVSSLGVCQRGGEVRSSGRARSVVPVAVALVLATTASAGAAPRLPRLLTGWYTRYSVRPTTIYYTGDGSGVIGKLRRRGGLVGPGRGYLRWPTWNQQRAVGTATLWLKLGSPTATSPFTRLTASVTANRVRNGHFTRLTLRYRFRGRRVTDRRCLPEHGPRPSSQWNVMYRGRCD